MEVWIVSAALFVVWFVLKVLMGKGGYIHIILLCAIGAAFVRFMQERRTAQK